MKKIRFSVYIIVPLIFSGLIIFTGLAVYRMTLYFGRYAEQENTGVIYGAISAVAVLAFFASLVILHVLLTPLKHIFQKQ